MVVARTENHICLWDLALCAVPVISWDTAENSEHTGIEGSFSTDFHGCWIRPLFSYFMNVQY